MQTPRSCRRRAFSLVELLVVIGVVVLLLAVLLPAVGRARVAAKRVSCASRLRQLAAACTMYLGEHRRYPPAPFIDVQGAAFPHLIRLSLLNELAPYVHGPAIDEQAFLQQLPAVMRCPFREEWQAPNFDASIPLPGGAIILTGYQYTAALDAAENAAAGRVLKLPRVPDARGRRRGVLWSDALSWYSGSGVVFLPAGSPPVWGYFHFTRGVNWAGTGMADTSTLDGQHRAWSDGSVEWVPAGSLDLRLDHRDDTASYAVGAGGAYYAYYWF
jgi:type II secretory pathway pseudopilin PulG